MKKFRCKSCDTPIIKKGHCLQCGDALSVAVDRAQNVDDPKYGQRVYIFDRYLEDLGLKEEIEKSARKAIDQWTSFPWWNKFYYRFIKKEFPYEEV